MRNKTLLRVVQVLGFILSIALMPAAQALQITMTVPDCPSGQTLQFSSNTNTLACTGSVTPQPTPGGCAINATPSSSSGAGLTAGTQVQLTASCTTGDQPITYSWNIGVLGSSLTVAPGSTTTYTVTPTNSAGPGATFSTTVYIGNGPVTGLPPSSCSISQSPNTAVAAVTAGTNVTLTASCSGGNAVTSCTWTNGISSTACSINVTAPSSNTSYTATANNQYGSATPTSTTIQVSSGTPPPNAQNFCTGSDTIINVNWPVSGQVRPSTNGFGNQKIAFRITIPANFTPALNINHLGFVRITETPGAAVTSRDFTVSKHSCDFQSGTYLYNANGFGDTSPGANFTVNNPNGFFSAGANFNAQSGEIIYVNVRNANNGAPSCPNTTCDVLFDFATPNRY